MKQLILVIGEKCPLCEESKKLLENLDLHNWYLEEKDIYSSRELHDKYWNKIPVLLCNNRELCWPFDVSKVQDFLFS